MPDIGTKLGLLTEEVENKMNEDYKKELADLKKKMQRAEKFAEKLPMFSEKILQDKISGKEQWIKFGDRYKDLYCAWGINRGFYGQELNRTITNYREDYENQYLFNVYINTLSQYNSHEKFGLEDIKDNVPVFFYDSMNSTFYATDDQIEGLLEALLAWYVKAKVEILEFNKKEKIKKLKTELSKLEESGE